MAGVIELFDAPGLGYLASPYSHEDRDVRHARFLKAEWALVQLHRTGIYAISPIVLWHATAERYNLPGDAEYWRAWNWRIFFTCQRLLLLRLDGWEESKGVQQELDYARQLHRSIFAVDIVQDSLHIERIP